jgi:hypothetical protein
MPRLSIRIVDDASPVRRPGDYTRMRAWRLDTCEIVRSKLRVLQRSRTPDDVAAENRIERLADWWARFAEPAPPVPVLQKPKKSNEQAQAGLCGADDQLPLSRVA